MLGRGLLRTAFRRPLVFSAQLPSTPIVFATIVRRGYASEGPPPKLHPLSKPTADDMDPRFPDLPDWNVPPVNRQDLTETPDEPYFDPQGRRYFGEPVLS